MHENPDFIMPVFYQYLAQQLLAKAEMIAGWGITHPPSMGANRENSVRLFLREFLPSAVNIGTGFIINDEQQISNQCDIIIYDDTIIPPLYRDEDIVVVRHTTVAMVIEVKTTLGKSELNDALLNISSAKTVAPHITGTIFGFLGPAGASETAKGWLEQFKNKGIFVPRTKQRRMLTSNTWVDYIYAILGKGKRKRRGFIAEIDKDVSPPLIKLRDCKGAEDIFWLYRYILNHTLSINFPSQTESVNNLESYIDVRRLISLVDLAEWLHIDIPDFEYQINLT
jgi:hypothetical protein